MLRVGPTMVIKAYMDAAYGVHQDSDKSHTGCAVVLGDAGPTFSKQAKQKIVIKSRTEAELDGLSDTASQAIHLMCKKSPLSNVHVPQYVVLCCCSVN